MGSLFLLLASGTTPVEWFDYVKFRLSVTSGSAGYSTVSTPDASLGKYMATSLIVDLLNPNLFDPVSKEEATDGKIEYRCLFVHNTHTTETMMNTKVWIGSQISGGADISIGVDPAGITDEDSSSAQAAEIADEGTAPVGVTFSSPYSYNAGLDIGEVGPGQCFAVWVRRKVPAGASARATDGALIYAGVSIT